MIGRIFNTLDASYIIDIDKWLDDKVSQEYKDQPLAQDWARVAKTVEEAGEAVNALIAWTGQNPRKGICGTKEELLNELADVAFAAIFAIQHFTKNYSRTDMILQLKLKSIYDRVQ